MREGWTYKKLGECFPYIKNGANIKQIKGAKGYPITRIETLSGGVFNRDRMGYADIFDINKYQDYILENGDLLMSHINSKTYIGRTVQYIYQDNEVIIHGMNLLRLRSNESVILSSFFKFYTDSWHFKTDIASIRKDAVNQSSFAISDLKNFKVPIPSLSEQQYIVAELGKINELISLKKAQLSDLDALAQSIFYDMFGDPIENEKGWEVKKLGEVVDITAKLVDPNQEPYCNQFHAGPANIIGGTGEIVNCQIAKDENLISGKYAFKSGDVLYSKIRPNLNKVAIPPFDGVCSADMYPLSIKTNAVNMYIMRLLMTKEFLKYAVNCSGRARMPKINREALFEFNFCLPPLSLQQEFAKRIELIEQQKAQISSTIKDLETLLASRMQHWFD